MLENTAKGVSSNTFAIKMEQSTQQFSAPYLNSDLVELNQKETLLKYQSLYYYKQSLEFPCRWLLC